MKFLYFSALVVTIGAALGFGTKQVPEATGETAVAWYHLSHVRDTLRPAMSWEEDFVLAFDASGSVFASDTRLTQDSLNLVKVEAAMVAGSDAVNIGRMLPTTNEYIYVQEDALYIQRRLTGNNFLIREPLEKINWKIEYETRQILGYTCQKATGVCKGRQYTAWFTTDVAAGYGPWKLHGLPGLILEAGDTGGRIRFTCTKVVLNGPVPHQLGLKYPADATLSSHAAFARMQKAQSENFSPLSSGDGSATVERTTVNGDAMDVPSKKTRINYPLELPH